MLIQQGDVLVKLIDKIPSTAIKVIPSKRGYINVI